MVKGRNPFNFFKDKKVKNDIEFIKDFEYGFILNIDTRVRIQFKEAHIIKKKDNDAYLLVFNINSLECHDFKDIIDNKENYGVIFFSDKEKVVWLFPNTFYTGCTKDSIGTLSGNTIPQNIDTIYLYSYEIPISNEVEVFKWLANV